MEWLNDAPTLFVILIAVIVVSVVTLVAWSEQAEQAEIRRQRDKYLESKQGRGHGAGLPFPKPRKLLSRLESSKAAKDAWARAGNDASASARAGTERSHKSPQTDFVTGA